MTNASELLEVLKRRETEIADPSPQAAEAVWRAIQARIAAGQPAPELDTGALIGGAAKPGAILLKIVGGGVLVAIVGLGLGAVARREPPVEGPPVQAVSVEAPAAAPAGPARVEAPPVRPADVSTGAGPSSPLPPSRSSRPPASDLPAIDPPAPSGSSKRPKPRVPEPDRGAPKTLADEIALTRRISSELKNGAWKRTLRLVAEHERDFPDGDLVEERQAAKARALCHVADGEAGREAAAAFERRWPASIHLAVVRRDCEGI